MSPKQTRKTTKKSGATAMVKVLKKPDVHAQSKRPSKRTRTTAADTNSKPSIAAPSADHEETLDSVAADCDLTPLQYVQDEYQRMEFILSKHLYRELHEACVVFKELNRRITGLSLDHEECAERLDNLADNYRTQYMLEAMRDTMKREWESRSCKAPPKWVDAPPDGIMAMWNCEIPYDSAELTK